MKYRPEFYSARVTLAFGGFIDATIALSWARQGIGPVQFSKMLEAVEDAQSDGRIQAKE